MDEVEQELIKKTKEMIQDLKSVCANNGIGNTGNEYKIITQVFLYKFLNDKFLYEVGKKMPQYKGLSIKEIESKILELNDNDYTELLMPLSASTAKFKREHLISYLYNRTNLHDGNIEGVKEKEFYQLFDNVLEDLSNFNIDIFSVRTGSEEKIKLFDNLSNNIIESNKKNSFCRSIIDKLINFSFEGAFNEKYDFFSTIFEFLIKDYNKDFGKYAEYYTPNSIARIIAQILVGNTQPQNVTVYDPSAGSGTLLLALAHQIGEDNCSLYTQDISQKSNEFLRLNLILNNLVHSLDNVVHGDTLVNPAHYNKEHTRLKQFDFIVSNPPFKTDFSDTRDQIDGDKNKDRFFAGVPSVPNKKKDSMAIYLCFIQHILYSLKDDGKAAIVVPTGFLTAQSGIEKKIRTRIIDNKWLKGVISMPSNIFANTGTNVSVLFIDKSNQADEVLLVDASNLGEKVKEDKNQKTVLRKNEITKIVNTFNNKESVDDFSVLVSFEEIAEKNYSFSAGQYFEIKIEYIEMTQEEFNNKINYYKNELNELFEKNQKLEKEISSNLERLKYE